jgi:hypothetical protein
MLPGLEEKIRDRARRDPWREGSDDVPLERVEIGKLLALLNALLEEPGWVETAPGASAKGHPRNGRDGPTTAQGRPGASFKTGVCCCRGRLFGTPP